MKDVLDLHPMQEVFYVTPIKPAPGVPVDLQLALRGLDTVRAILAIGLVTDYVAGRFDFTDDENGA
jgi:hypothetical protein